MEILADRKTYRWVLLLKDLPICMYFYRVHYMKLKAIYNTIHVKIIFTCIWTITCISVIVVRRRAAMWPHRQFCSRFEYCVCTSPPYVGSISIKWPFSKKKCNRPYWYIPYWSIPFINDDNANDEHGYKTTYHNEAQSSTIFFW